MAALMAVSLATWALGGWVVDRAAQEALFQSGSRIQATLDAYLLGQQVTVVWVVGVLGMHGALAGLAWWRDDRDALGGVWRSGLLLAVWVLAQGVVGCPGSAG